MAKHKFASISLTVRDRAISLKISTHRVSKECNLCKYYKNFPLPRYGGHVEFSKICQKWQNTNLLLSRLTVKRDRSKFRRNFRPTGYLRHVIFAIFKKISLPQKWPPFLGIFENILPKLAKHKFASISLTVRDRAISSKFSTHRVSKECNICNFQKIFPSPKMAAILNFRIFAKNGKTQICFYLLNR